MGKNKLVPMEPTLEMMEAGAEGCGQDLDRDEARGRAFVAYKAMIAAAPAVQAEPVGWVWHSYNQTNFTSGSHHKEVLEADGVKLTPVYTAPQPAVQGEPVAEVVWPDVEGRRGGFRQFGQHSSPRLPAGTKLYAHPQPTEQKPSPDVEGLVEALESLLEVQDEDCRYDHQGYCQNHNLDHINDGCRVAKARSALAAHRRQGG